MNYLINTITDYVVKNSLNSSEESLFTINGFEDISIYTKLCQSITNELSSSGKTVCIKLANRKWEYFKQKFAGNPQLLKMKQEGWISEGKSTTYYRNLHESDVLILMGTEDEDDAVGSLKDIITITPSNLINLVEKAKGVTKFDSVFAFTEYFSDKEKQAVNKLYRDLFKLVNVDLIKLSKHADLWNARVSTFEDFIKEFYDILPDWGLPKKTDKFPTKEQLEGRTNLLRTEFNFINRIMFPQLSASKYKSYIGKLDKYEAEQKTYSSIWDGWSSQKEGLKSYEEFSDALLDFISGNGTTELKNKLINTNFSVVEEILGLKSEKNKQKNSEKIYGNPLYAFTKSALNVLCDIKQNKDLPSVSKIQFKFNEATIVANDNEDDSLIQKWRNICIHTKGVFEYITDRLMLSMDGEDISIECEPFDYFDITMEAKPYVNKASGNKTINKIDFKILCLDDSGNTIIGFPAPECEWIFKYNENWLNSFAELCSQDFVKTRENEYIPLAINNKLSSLIDSKSNDDFMEILNEESDTDFSCNLLDQKAFPVDFKTSNLRKSFHEVGKYFSLFANELSSCGLYNLLNNTSGEETLNNLLKSYTDLGSSILKERVNENEYYLLNYFIHAFNIEQNTDSISGEKEIQYCIVPPWHPASLEKLKHMCIFFMDGCHEYWKETEDGKSQISKKAIKEKINELIELSLFQNAVDIFPTSSSTYFGVTKNYGLYTIYSRDDIKVDADTDFRDLIDKDAVFDDNFNFKSYSVMNDDAQMILNVIENYNKAFPNSNDNLTFAFVNPVDLQPIIAAINKYIEEFHSKYGNDCMLSIKLKILVKPENMGGKNYLAYWMNETFDLDSYVKIKTYLNVWNNREELNNYIGENNDIVFVMGLLKTNNYSFVNDEDIDFYEINPRECYFPIVFRPGLISSTISKKRIIELTQPQFKAATIHTQVAYYKFHIEKIPEGSYFAVKNVVFDDEGENIIRDFHQKSYWVVCIDNGMDGAFLKNKSDSSKDYSVIGFSTGKGKFGQYNLTITARKSVVNSTKERFAERLRKMFLWDDSLIKKASNVCMNEASYLDGISVLRASNKNDYNINEFMAYVLTSLREKEDSCQSPLRTIVHLDSYKHWFSGKNGENSIFVEDSNKLRPDFLVLEVDQDYSKKIKIHAKIVECKISSIENKSKHIEKALTQVKHGARVLEEIFNPNSDALKRRYWFAQLYRALAFSQITFANSSDEFKEISNKLRDILNGDFEIDWNKEILGYWVDLSGDSDIIENIEDVNVVNIPQLRIQKLLLKDKNEEDSLMFVPDVNISLFRDEKQEASDIKNREELIQNEYEQYKAGIARSSSRRNRRTDYDVSKSKEDYSLNEQNHPNSTEISNHILDSERTIKQIENDTNLQDKSEENVASDQKEPVDSLKDFETNNEETRVMIGKNRYNEKIYWEFGHKLLANRHLLITGTSGQGKTYGIQAMLYELSKTNISSVIFDYTEGFMPDQLEPKFKELMGDRINQDIILHSGVPINPFKRQEIEIAGIKMTEKVESVASRIASIFTHVYGFGEQQYSAIFNAARNGMNNYGDKMSMKYFKNELENIRKVNSSAKTVVSKMEPFIFSIDFKDDDSFDWGKILYSNQSRVNIFQLTHIDRDMQVIITELLLWDAWYYTQKFGKKDKPFVVVLDEAQNLSHKDNSPSAKILTEGRKFGWSAWYATQSLKVLSDDEVVRLMQAAFKLYFKPTDEEITKISKQIDPSDSNAWVSSIKNLNKGQCIVVGDRIKNDGSFGSIRPTIVTVEPFERRD